VAAGTVLYHFPTVDELAAAVVRQLAERSALPGPRALPAGGAAGASVRALVRLLYEFYARTEGSYPFFLQNQHHPAVAEAFASYERGLDGLLAGALGQRAASPPTRAVVAALVDVTFYANLSRGGLALEEAIEAASDLAASALSRR
jgi:AcrR family transcriptional regulator